MRVVPDLSARTYRRLTGAIVAFLAVVIVSGAAVRLTNSGLGCADWPNCNADSFVSVGSRHEAIEQLNRLLSGAIGVPIAYAAKPAWILKTWDKFIIPSPFARICIAIGEPYFAPEELDEAGMEGAQRELENRLHETYRAAKKALGPGR